MASGSGLARLARVLVCLAAGLMAACGNRGASDEHASEAKTDHDHDHGHDREATVKVGPDFVGPGKLDLPDDLRSLIVAEMVQVEAAMHRILSALVRGDLQAVQASARGVHDSFILAQKLTPEQATSLHKLLPPEFVTMDHEFHAQAEGLAEAAAAGDVAAATRAYTSMSDACITCHTAYARERFPGLGTR